MRAFRNLSTAFARLAISYCLVASVIFLAIPTQTTGQKPGRGDEMEKAIEKPTPGVEINGTLNKMSANSYAEARAAAMESNSGVATAPTATGNSVRYYVLNVEFKTPVARRLVFSDLKKSNLAGAFVLTAVDRFATIFIDREAAWTALLANPNVVKVEHSSRVDAPPPPVATPSLLTSLAVPESIVRGGYRGLTGKNTIIAVLDTGIDYKHPDFITYDPAGRATSRIAYLWDTATEFRPGRGNIAPVRFPNGTSIGTLYTRADLTDALKFLDNQIPPTDLDGHGTACASVAAGNGNADKFSTGLKRNEVIGVAPDADIIAVRLGETGLENSYLINAIAEWLDKVAGRTPLVISGSYGGHFSGHDGQLVEERELAVRFPLAKPGRALVFAAGNEATDDIHSAITFDADDKYLSFTAKEKTIIKIYYDSADRNILLSGIKSDPLGSRLSRRINPITNQREDILEVRPGQSGIWLENTAGKPTEAHLYFMSRNHGTFSPEHAVSSHLVGSPGAMSNAITVGSYDWNDNFHIGGRTINLTSMCRDKSGTLMPFEIGWLSCYSSTGPARNGVVKPEIVAPGEWFASANAKANGKNAGDWARTDSTGYYRAMNGTSAATPYTSGIIALMFEKKPALTLGQVKALLNDKASKQGLSPFGSKLPNYFWGHGKLDEAAVDRIFASL